MADRDVEFTSDSVGPFYAYPASEADFADWLTERIACDDADDRWTVTLDDQDDYYIFEGSTAPTSWYSSELFVDFSVLRLVGAINSSGVVTIVSPVSEHGELSGPIVIGDDYTADTGRALTWRVTEPTLDIDECTAILGAKLNGVSVFEITGTIDAVTVSGLDYWDMSFDVPHATTILLSESLYSFSVEVQQATPERFVNLVLGTFRAVRDAVAPPT